MRILIVGYFGEGNLGDDLLLDALVGRVRYAVPGSEIVVTWGGRSRWAAPAIERIDRSIAEIERALGTVDTLIIGPGGILHNARGYGNLHHDTGIHYYDRITAAARERGLSILAVGIGLGPITGAAARRAVRRTLDRCTSVTVRDARSTGIALRIGVHDTVLVPDLVWDTPSLIASDRPPAVLGQLAISMRPWSNQAITRRLASNVSRAVDLLTSDGTVSSVVGVPMSVGDSPDVDDTMVLRDTLDRIETPTPTRISVVSCRRDAEIALAESQVVLAMRLHAVILASIVGTPTVGMAYDEKVSSVVAASGGTSISLNASPEEIVIAIRQATGIGALPSPDARRGLVDDQLSALASDLPTEHAQRPNPGSSLERVLIALGI